MDGSIKATCFCSYSGFIRNDVNEILKKNRKSLKERADWELCKNFKEKLVKVVV